MNRREMLAAAAAGLSAGGGTMSMIPCDLPAAFVLSMDKHLSARERDNLREKWTKTFVGPLADVPLIILERGATLSAVDKSGNILSVSCNQEGG